MKKSSIYEHGIHWTLLLLSMYYYYWNRSTHDFTFYKYTSRHTQVVITHKRRNIFWSLFEIIIMTCVKGPTGQSIFLR